LVNSFMCRIRGYGGKHQKNIFTTVFGHFHSQMNGFRAILGVSNVAFEHTRSS
jgi:hypothetical protein